MLSTTQLAQMRTTTQGVMFDTCRIGTRSETPDAHGQLVPTYTDGAALPCGFNPTGNASRRTFVQSGEVAIVLSEPKVRLPLGTAIAQGDRVTITHRSGEALVPLLVYYVAGATERGLTALTVPLRAVTT